MISSTNHYKIHPPKVEDYPDEELEQLRLALSPEALLVLDKRDKVVLPSAEVFIEYHKLDLVRSGVSSFRGGRIWWFNMKAEALSQYVRRREIEVSSTLREPAQQEGP